MDATRVTMLNCVGFRDNYLQDYSLLSLLFCFCLFLFSDYNVVSL